MPETEVFDCKGKRIVVGARVVMDPGDLPAILGTVKEISDPDVDVNDEGRQVGINPTVYVQWDDCDEGDLDDLRTCYAGDPLGDLPEFTCDDLEVIAGGKDQ